MLFALTTNGKKPMKKNLLMLLAAAIVAAFLSGCCTVYETEGLKLDRAQTFDMNLKLEGFELRSLQKTGTYMGTTTASAYNYQTNAYVSGNANTVGSIYQMCPDEGFANGAADAFETLGFNIRSEHPDLILSGRIGGGRFPWNSWEFWIRDVPVFFVALPAVMTVLSCTRENDAEMIVYDRSGKRLATYSGEHEYTAFSIGFPFANFANPKAYEWYGDRQAAGFSLADCLNQFTADLKAGKFDQNIKAAKAKYKEKKTDEN